MTAHIIPNTHPTDTAVVLAASRRLWGSAAYPSERGTGNRRMVAVGHTNPHGALVSVDEHENYYA